MKTIQFNTIPDLFPAGVWHKLKICSPIALAQYWGTEVQCETTKSDAYTLETNSDGHQCTLHTERAEVAINGAVVLLFVSNHHTQH